MGLLVAGTKYRGEFEERLKKLMEEIKQNEDIILFIDEVHTLIGAGAAEGAIDAANILKPALARGELQVYFLTLNSGASSIMLYLIGSYVWFILEKDKVPKPSSRLTSEFCNFPKLITFLMILSM